MGTTGRLSADGRLVALAATLGVLAVLGVTAGLVDAGFADALGRFARLVAVELGAGKQTATIVEVGVEAASMIASVLWL
jgi:hypothetical protein